jgi:hypothetical protein
MPAAVVDLQLGGGQAQHQAKQAAPHAPHHPSQVLAELAVSSRPAFVPAQHLAVVAGGSTSRDPAAPAAAPRLQHTSPRSQHGRPHSSPGSGHPPAGGGAHHGPLRRQASFGSTSPPVARCEASELATTLQVHTVTRHYLMPPPQQDAQAAESDAPVAATAAHGGGSQKQAGAGDKQEQAQEQEQTSSQQQVPALSLAPSWPQPGTKRASSSGGAAAVPRLQLSVISSSGSSPPSSPPGSPPGGGLCSPSFPSALVIPSPPPPPQTPPHASGGGNTSPRHHSSRPSSPGRSLSRLRHESKPADHVHARLAFLASSPTPLLDAAAAPPGSAACAAAAQQQALLQQMSPRLDFSPRSAGAAATGVAQPQQQLRCGEWDEGGSGGAPGADTAASGGQGQLQVHEMQQLQRQGEPGGSLATGSLPAAAAATREVAAAAGLGRPLSPRAPPPCSPRGDNPVLQRLASRHQALAQQAPQSPQPCAGSAGPQETPVLVMSAAGLGIPPIPLLPSPAGGAKAASSAAALWAQSNSAASARTALVAGLAMEGGMFEQHVQLRGQVSCCWGRDAWQSSTSTRFCAS